MEEFFVDFFPQGEGEKFLLPHLMEATVFGRLFLEIFISDFDPTHLYLVYFGLEINVTCLFGPQTCKIIPYILGD